VSTSFSFNVASRIHQLACSYHGFENVCLSAISDCILFYAVRNQTVILFKCLHVKTRCSQRWQTCPCATSWRTGRNICNVFDSGLFSPLCENITLPTKPEMHNIIALSLEKARATGNVQKIW